MKQVTLLLVMLGCSLYGFSQTDLVSFDDLTFSSQFEQKVFDNHFNKRSEDPFMLFMGNGQLVNESGVADAKKRFDQQVATLNNEKVLGKKNDKKIKAIYDQLHKEMLFKYETEGAFENIFYNGSYNCVSGSALYALALDKLNIPFIIKEKQSEVYLIAYPDTDRVLIETNSPLADSYGPDQAFKENFINVMKQQKLISAKESARMTVDQLFDKFYFGKDADLTLFQLVGIQYINSALSLIRQLEYSAAVEELEKAYMFYPSSRVSYLIMICSYETLTSHDKKDLVHAECISRLSRFKQLGITSDMIKAEYGGVVQDLLFDKGQIDGLDAYFEKLTSKMPDPALKADLTFYHFYEKGRYNYNQARFKESMAFFEQCLTLQPRHQEAIKLLLACIKETGRNMNGPSRMQFLESYSIKIPTLLENNIFNELLGYTYLAEAYNAFTQNRPADGEQNRQKFEMFQKDHSDVSYDETMLGMAYSAGAVYYFRKNQTAKAKSLISAGLAISPNNYELQSRKRMLSQ